jgi:hypothetical protein
MAEVLRKGGVGDLQMDSGGGGSSLTKSLNNSTSPYRNSLAW